MARKPASRRKSDLSPEDLLSEVKAGRLKPLYFLHGPEDLTRDECLRALTDAAVDPATRAFNLDVFRADDADAADIVNRAIAFPMMASRRLVIVKQVERLPEAAITDFLPVVMDPPDTTVLVLTATRFDARRKLFAELRKSAVCVTFKDPYDREVPDWIQRRVKATGKTIQPEAVHLLHITVGPNPRELANELEKLAIHVADRATIHREDVEQVVGATRGNTVFELADAVGRREAERAYAILNRLLEQGESPVGIVAMISRHIGILRKARWLQAARVPRQQMAGRLKVPPFFLSGYLEQARQFSDDALAAAYDALVQADDRLKSGSRSAGVTMAVLVHTLCREGGTRGRGVDTAAATG
jgi:DNA polymerase-3 subunit delta